MSSSLLLPTGNSALDQLRVVQLAADEIDDPATKKAFIRSEVAGIPKDGLIDERLRIVSAMVVGGIRSGNKIRRFLFSQGMQFLGNAAAYGYLYQPEEAIDSITVSFIEPVVERPDEVVGDFAAFSFHAPVLAIDYIDEMI